jgi:hopanoid biosynthesis associated protein HpnK
MARPDRPRLIVNADDFGRSPSINEAVVRAHRDGILTTASLMVNELSCDEAVRLAKENPRLGVGLHLALVCGKSALSPEEIPGLIDAQKNFSNNAVAAGVRFFFVPKLKAQLRAEIEAQFEKFRATGLPLDHVNGHLNIHLHPVVFRILEKNFEQWGIKRFRLTSDPFWLNFKLADGELLYRTSHAAIYKILSHWAAPKLRRANVRHTQNVFGLLQNARVNEEFLLKFLPRLSAGDSELYSHPSLDNFKHEFDALISPRVKNSIAQLGIELIRYQDL